MLLSRQREEHTAIDQNAVGSVRENAPPGVHGHPLHGGEFVKTPLAVKSTDAGHLAAAERNDRLVVDTGVVDVDHPGVNLAGYSHPALDITGVHAAAETEVAVIRDCHCFFVGVKAGDDGDGPEQLLAEDVHFRCYVGHDSWSEHRAID